MIGFRASSGANMGQRNRREKQKGKRVRVLRRSERLEGTLSEHSPEGQTTHAAPRIPGRCGLHSCEEEEVCVPVKDSPDQHYCVKSKQGRCESHSCANEEACVPVPKNNGTALHYCLCVNGGEPPSKDFMCPRFTGIPGRCGLHSCEEEEVCVPVKDSPDQHYCVKSKQGRCESHSCANEEACVPVPKNNGTALHYCLCVNGGEPPSKDFMCPRFTVPVVPKPVLNVQPPSSTRNNSDAARFTLSPTGEVPNSLVTDVLPDSTGTTGTETGIYSGTVSNNSALLAASAVVGALVLVIVIALVVICYLRRRICVVAGKGQPRVRPGEPLLAERYITNPQYGVCGAGTAAAPAPATPAALPTVTSEGTDDQVPLLDRHALTFLEEVGEGCFGKVHKGLLRLENEEQVVAIKVLKKSAGRSAEEDFVREVSIMSAFRHSNILSLIGVVHREDIDASPWMVFEYMEWGDLAGVLRGCRGGGRAGPTLDEAALLHVALQVARGMEYLASRRFVHRDLAARNCLVGANLTVKIADFGMSRDVYTCDYYKMGGERPMPVRWMSPESIVYARFTHESDVWSYGVVLWEIYSRGKQPFYGHTNFDASKLILQGIVLVPPENCPRFACELMRACWRTDPRDRIGFEEICRKLEIAASAGGATQIRLPRPPPPPQDSAGYLIPAPQPPVDYLATIPDPESSEEDEDDEYT